MWGCLAGRGHGPGKQNAMIEVLGSEKSQNKWIIGAAKARKHLCAHGGPSRALSKSFTGGDSLVELDSL